MEKELNTKSKISGHIIRGGARGSVEKERPRPVGSVEVAFGIAGKGERSSGRVFLGDGGSPTTTPVSTWPLVFDMWRRLALLPTRPSGTFTGGLFNTVAARRYGATAESMVVATL
jgi:hypothetical protein